MTQNPTEVALDLKLPSGCVVSIVINGGSAADIANIANGLTTLAQNVRDSLPAWFRPGP